MLRIINAGKYLPTSYFVDSQGYFQPGMIGMITGPFGPKDYTCGVCNGPNPIGIIDDVRNGKDDSTFLSQRITIWNVPIIFETDMFEYSGIYHPGDEVGVSPKGLFSPALSDIKISGPVAKIISWSLVPGKSGPNSFSGPEIRLEWIPQTILHTLGSASPVSTKKTQSGMHCIKCNTLNQYIDTGNQPDGSYKCGPCRS